MNLGTLIQSSIGRIFKLGPEFVRACVYYRPAGFAPATGFSALAESNTGCLAFIAPFRSGELGTVSVQPGDERVVIRASELAGISNPAVGDYLVESSNTLRRDVISVPRLDPSGLLWTFHCVRSLNQDWGDLYPYTDSEDRGDLSAPDTSDDFGTLV